MFFHIAKLILHLSILDLTDKFLLFSFYAEDGSLCYFIVSVIGSKSLISQLAVRVKGWWFSAAIFKKLSINSLHRLLREWVFFLTSPTGASRCLWLAQPGREDGWICHWLVNCVAGLSLTSGLWLLSGSIQNKLADCSHISHSICFDFVECSP